MTLRRSITFALAAAAVACLCANSRADTLPPLTSYKKLTPGGQFVFVMLLDSEPPSAPERMAAEARELRRLYPKSGMYRNDGSAEPLWTVDWFARSVELASDGVHIIRHSMPHGPDGEVVSFFANGKLLRTYRLGELVRDTSQFERSGGGILLGAIGETRFDEAKLEYTLMTGEDKKFVFDVRTGEPVGGSSRSLTASPSGTSASLWWAAGLIAVVVAIALAVWFLHRQPQPDPTPPPLPAPRGNG